MTDISIIVPVLNEFAEIDGCLDNLARWRERGHEVIVVDGGSKDRTAEAIGGRCDILIGARPGRARQMNAGAALARGRLLLFLHVDTRLPVAAEPVLAAIARSTEQCWGRFDIRLNGAHVLFRVIEFMMNWRSRLTAIATGDQAIFVTGRTFHGIGGYADIDLMEDLELSGRLRQIAKPICLTQRVWSSPRRWQKQGIVRTVIRMWCCRVAYFCGVSPGRLKGLYDTV